MSRISRNRKTTDYDNMKYSPELIRQLSDPEYTKKAEEYERQARRGKHSSSKEKSKSSRSGRSKAKKKYAWRPRKLVKNILCIFLIFLVLALGAFYLLTGSFDEYDTSNSNFAITDTAADQLSGYRNIAILGVDAREGESYDGSRTDAIIIMSIKKSSGEVRLISVMRDSYLKMEYTDGSMILDKITHANHWKDAANTCAAINRSLDLNIDEFVMFDWKSVADMVDVLGGVEINVKESELADLNKWGPETAENVGVDFTKVEKAGKQTLDGAQAVTYCRIRKTSGGDSGRGERYKKVVTAVMKKAMSNPGKLKTLSDEVFPNIRTNLSQTQMLTLGLGFVRYDFGDSISWPDEYYSGLLADGISYVVPRTLESNVIKLHEEAFGQDNYTPSSTCLEISNEIIYNTGVE